MFINLPFITYTRGRLLSLIESYLWVGHAVKVVSGNQLIYSQLHAQIVGYHLLY